MASDPILHVKDSYYFELPRLFWPKDYESTRELADQAGPWTVHNDADYQDWEADRFIGRLGEIIDTPDALGHAKEAWKEWQHADPHRHGRPFDQYVVDALAELDARASEWAQSQDVPVTNATTAYLAEHADEQLTWMHSLRINDQLAEQWSDLRQEFNQREALDAYLGSPRGEWPAEKMREYNLHLSGKIMIPQPFATLKNAYEVQSGFGISRYMIIEVLVAIVLLLVFRWVAKKAVGGGPPLGKLWNLLESFLTFIKTDIVEKGIEPKDSPKFLPLFWTLFLFILGCNLAGMIPGLGSPTAALGLTGILALVVFAVGCYLGIQKFGFVGYLKNLCPELGLPMYLGIFIVPMVWVIEFASLFIKHAILAIRLLANMAAGHLVLLGIMGLAFGAHAASMQTGSWTALSVVAILGTTVLSFMEVFVAFLQAYVFTLLAALFIGSATHHH